VNKTCNALLIVTLISFPLCFAQDEGNYRNSREQFVETSVLSGGAEDAGFGSVLAIDPDGDTLVVGAPNDTVNGNFKEGSVYIFQKSHEGRFRKVAQLTASDGNSGSFFGSASISGDGNTIVVGAHGVSAIPGAAYIYVKPPSGWKTTTETVKLTSLDVQAQDEFGLATAINHWGDTVFVSTTQVDNGAGAVYVFCRDGKNWKSTSQYSAKLTAPGSTGLGNTLSLSQDGRTLLVGALGADGSGAAYIFIKPEDGWMTTAEAARLTASDSVPFDAFGVSVSLDADGDTALVGAPSQGPGFPEPITPGAVYLYTRPRDGWVDMTESAKLTASDGQPGDEFGTSVAIAPTGKTAFVGAFSAGSAYLYYEPRDGWETTAQFQQKLKAHGNPVQFGAAVLIAQREGNKTLVVGAEGATVNPNSPFSGAVYLFERVHGEKDKN